MKNNYYETPNIHEMNNNQSEKTDEFPYLHLNANDLKKLGINFQPPENKQVLFKGMAILKEENNMENNEGIGLEIHELQLSCKDENKIEHFTEILYPSHSIDTGEPV